MPVICGITNKNIMQLAELIIGKEYILENNQDVIIKQILSNKGG